MKTIRAYQNESLDAVIYRAVGFSRGMLEKVLLLNPHLAEFSVLPIGTVVKIPDESQQKQQETINLWS